jgi:hypothetical protein
MRTKKKSRLTNDYSKQIDEQLHRISFREIKILWSILGGLSLTRADFVRARFMQDGLHYSDVTNFLKQLGLLRMAKGQISRMEDLGKTDEEMKSALVQRFLTRNTSFRSHMNEFFGHFESVDEKFEILMDAEKRRRFAGIRNLLLELEFLEQDFSKPRYWISPQHLAAFIDAKSAWSTSPTELQDVLRAREMLGREAELEVLKFERERLRHRSSLAKRIEHVAAENIGAGYDILSFTEAKDIGGFAERLIEVKAVSPTDFRFYWSRNEIETARIHGQNYFLYLIPASKNGFDMQKVRIIPDPFKRVYLDGKSWLRQEELVSFWPTKMR